MAWQLQKKWTRDRAIRQPFGFKKILLTATEGRLVETGFSPALLISSDESEKKFSDPEI